MPVQFGLRFDNNLRPTYQPQEIKCHSLVEDMKPTLAAADPDDQVHIRFCLGDSGLMYKIRKNTEAKWTRAEWSIVEKLDPKRLGEEELLDALTRQIKSLLSANKH